MDIKYWEHCSSTDERASTVKGRYLHKDVAIAMSESETGWYGAKDWVSERNVFISEAKSLSEAKADAIKSSVEYRKYLELHEKFKDVK